MKKKTLWLGVFSLASFMLALNAQAVVKNETKAGREEVRTELKADQEQRKIERVENREENKEQRCARIQERLQNRIGNFEDGKEQHMSVYKNMVARVSKFIEKLAAEGYDTAKVKADLETLQTKIAKFSADKDARLAALGETKNYACGKTDGEFKAKLGEARKALQLVHSDAMDIRKFVQGTLKQDIQALRKTKMETERTTEEAKTGAPELE